MKKSTCLRSEVIERCLSGDLASAELDAAEEHLSECDDCRNRIDRSIGSAAWWREVNASLSDSSLQQPTAISNRSAAETDRFVDLLGPSDDPRMLGRVGSYEISGVIGRGGMGVVFKGFDTALNRFVAIKLLSPHLAHSGTARQRFAREARAAAAVIDDHVMPIHCVDEWQGIPFIVMPYSRGMSLQKRLNDEGALGLREVLRIGIQTAKGLSAAHTQGIVHRDVKPANILLDTNVERIALVDFGLARAVDDISLTCTGTLAGTPQYMSPEQARAETVDTRSDLFSLGAVMYATCTGFPPFRAETSYGVLQLIADNNPRPIREMNPDIPEWLCTVIAKLMAKRPEDRFASAQYVAEMLEACLAHVQHPTEARLPKEIATLSRNPIHRPAFLIGAIAMLALVGSIVFAITIQPTGDSSSDSEFQALPKKVIVRDGPPKDRAIQDRSAKPTGRPATASGILIRPPAASHTIHIVDTEGQPIEECEVLIHTPRGARKWDKAFDGRWRGDLRGNGDVIDVIVRAKGYASQSRRFQGKSLSELLSSQTTLTLERGRDVRVKLNLPDGVTLPDDVRMESFFPQVANRLRMAKSALNSRTRYDANMLNLVRLSDDEFSFRIPTDFNDEFYLAFHHPGWLRFFEVGSFDSNDIVDDVIDIDLPEPATIEVTFDVGSSDAARLPFTEAFCRIYWMPGETEQIYGANRYDVVIKPGEPVSVSDLAPGTYIVDVNTKPADGLSVVKGTDINPGEFVGRAKFTLKSGELRKVRHSWRPFDPDAYIGQAKAQITIFRADGAIASGERAQIMWSDGHYGDLLVHDGQVPADGIISLEGISAKRRGYSETGNQYTVVVGGQRIGFFTLDDKPTTQEFKFRITPQPGGKAPEFTLVDVASKRPTKLSDLEGKVVLLEFWSINCGPCQPAMQKLNKLAIANKVEWHDRVAILSISMDDAAAAAEHAASRGWNAIPHYVGTQDTDAKVCDIAIDYAIYSYPQAVLLAPDGMIIWRGHPDDTRGGGDIGRRINSLLSQSKKNDHFGRETESSAQGY